MLLLLCSIALAADPLTPPPVPVAPTAPALEDSITLVPESALLTFPDGTKFTVPRKSFLLPERFYDTALVKAKQLDICQPALDTCSTTTLAWQTRTYDALTACSTQFGEDTALVSDLTGKLQSMETRALVAEDRLKQSRKNTMVAWAITGGLVLGASTVMVVTVAD